VKKVEKFKEDGINRMRDYTGSGRQIKALREMLKVLTIPW